MPGAGQTQVAKRGTVGGFPDTQIHSTLSGWPVGTCPAGWRGTNFEIGS